MYNILGAIAHPKKNNFILNTSRYLIDNNARCSYITVGQSFLTKTVVNKMEKSFKPSIYIYLYLNDIQRRCLTR